MVFKHDTLFWAYIMNYLKRGLAIYTLIVLTCFAVYSIFYAVVGDNAPFWILIAVLCMPVIAFAAIYLYRKS